MFLNDKLVVPKDLRNEMLEKLHTGHFGLDKSKARARKIFYWPHLANDVHKFVTSCKTCLKFSRNNIKEPLIQHSRPSYPFAKVAADILMFGGKDYLVVVDYYSNWIELIQLQYKTASEIINKLKVIFSTFGIPTTFVSDNMPFNSKEFKNFAEEWDFNIITSSPRYPKSNGLAERTVGICKEMLRKSQEAGTDIYKSILEYRTTPLAGVEVSPSELLNNRLLRTTLPITSKLLSQNQNINIKKLKERREKNKIYYDRSARYKRDFVDDESVLIRKENCWVPGQVLNKTVYPRSYNVKDSFGNVYRRNSYFLKHNPNPVPPPKSSPENVNVPVKSNVDSDQNEKVIIASDPSSSDITNVTREVPYKTANAANNVYHTRSGRAVVKPPRYVT